MAGRCSMEMAVVALIMMLSQTGMAEVPGTMSYQGMLTDSTGAVVGDGTYTLTVSIYDTETGGNALWEETHEAVAVMNGVFSVMLGSVNPLDIAFDRQYWLGMCVDGGVEMIPRAQLTSVAYSLSARTVSDGQVVRSINALTDDITLAAGSNIQITRDGSTITVSAPDMGKSTTTGSIAGTDDWLLVGNAGTVATNFLGTTDNMPLNFHVNNTRALRLEPHSKSPNVIGGFVGNSVTPGIFGATIGGGGQSTLENTISGSFGAIGGGRKNDVSGVDATIGGGNKNTASDTGATIGGGKNNKANQFCATVGGGYLNYAFGNNATVAGGKSNKANGNFSTVPGGFANIADGDYSFAGGYRSRADHNGSFVWSDAGPDPVGDVHTFGNNQFLVRAYGGTEIYSGYLMDVAVPDWRIGVRLPPNATAWVSLSDRSAKRNIRPVDGRAILTKLAQIPISRWSYRSRGPSVEHIGPMAQDFYSAFGVGEDNRYISTIDPDGVALAAIQGLYAMVQEKEAQIATLEERVAKLEALVLSLTKEQ